METLKELRAIIAGKPDGATHVKSEPDFNEVILYYKKFNTELFFFLGDSLVDVAVKMEASRSLSDIERIIEQHEMLEIAWSAIQEAGYEDFCYELREYMERL